MKVDPKAGTITWSPEPEQAGTHLVSLVVDDLQGGRSMQTFEIVVGSLENPPPASAEQQ